jgi:hypothetical protein
MNSLEYWLSTKLRTERAVMDELQMAGIISDECVYARDVDEGDAKKAVEWLQSQKG